MTLVFVLLMLSPLFTVTNQVTLPRTQNIVSEKMNNISETDLERVDWVTNVAPNRDFETWNNPYSPENIYTTRTEEEALWIETTIVNEGFQSVGMEVKSLDPYHYSEVRLTQSMWLYWDNPINTTIDLDWHIDEIGNPINEDYFRMQVRMSNRNMYYYLGCDTTWTNGTDGYFLIDGSKGTWNHLHRNVTSDYIEIFGETPIRFDLIYWWVRSYTNEYTRVFMDDINLVNGTDVKLGGAINNGDFEGGGGWFFQSSYDPAHITQSSLAYAGDWSMNMTAISYDDLSRARAEPIIEKRLSENNKGQLSFQWRIDDWINSSTNTIASVRVTASNTTTSMSMYYYLCVGGDGTLPILISGEDMKFQVTNFNVTDQWNHFDRNIWDDFHSNSATDELWIESIIFQVSSSTDNSRLSVLFDELDFTASIVNDMGYETQGDLGTPIEGWREPTSDPEFSVTDFAYTGDRAGNITLEDDIGLGIEQDLGYIPMDSTTELILDFNIYIDTFNMSSDDFIFFEVECSDSILSFIIANASSEVESWMGGEEDEYILLQYTIVTGQWLNFQIDLVHSYESFTGSLPDTTLEQIVLNARASQDSKLVAFIDDLYIYYDSAPEITDVSHSPVNPANNGFVLITATVVDATIETVQVNYRVEDNSSWYILSMSLDSDTTFKANMTELVADSVFEYSITAIDTFGKSVESLNGTEYYSFTVGSPITTTIVDPGVTAILLAVALLAIGVIFVVYVFVIKKK